LNQLKNVVYFTKLDLRSGYYQIKIEWLVISFGSCNAPVTIMRVMNDVFRYYIDYFVNLDDISIFSLTWKNHIMHVKTIFELLKKEKLYVKIYKCEFGKNSLVYLGYIVGNGKIKIDPSKVEVIVNWPKPTTTTEVRSFLGVVQYWRKFIANLSFISTPLYLLTSVKHVIISMGRKATKILQGIEGKDKHRTSFGSSIFTNTI
jgi:hypothetical protein